MAAGTYPHHLARYPAGLIPRSRGRRGGMSIGKFVYLGSHPVLTLIALTINAAVFAVVLGWITLVTIAWLAWAAAVGLCWLVSLPFRMAA